MGRGPAILRRPPKGTTFRREGRKKPKLAKVARNPRLVTKGAHLWDGTSEYIVADVHTKEFGERWVRLYNVEFPENRPWFRLDDCGELAVIIGKHTEPTE